MIQNNKQSAFTLIELIIAIGVFTVGIMGAFTLALADLRLARENQDKVLAADLAREGIELIRNIRDTNWLRLHVNDDCDTSTEELELCTPSSYINVGVKTVDIYDDYPNPLQDIGGCNPDNLDTCLCPGGACDLRVDANNYYSHDPSGTATNFVRKIGVRKICKITSGEGGAETESLSSGMQDCISTLTEIGVEVTARVSWSGYGQNYHIDVRELMYNWRR